MLSPLLGHAIQLNAASASPIGMGWKLDAKKRSVRAYPASIKIQTIARERRDEDFASYFELCGFTSKLLEHGTDARCVRGRIPIEVQRDEDVHSIDRC